MDPSTSNVVLLSMVTMLQQELDASEKRATALESLREAQAGVIRVQREEIRQHEATATSRQAGAEVITRGLDAMYNKAKLMYERGEMLQEDWSDYYRFMLRADIGYALLNGAGFVDLTANEDMESDGETTVPEDDGDETETDEEMEDD